MDARDIDEGNGWARAFGGVGNALGCRLEIPGAGEIVAVPEELPEVAGAAFLEVMVLDETKPGAVAPLHPMVGQRLRIAEVTMGVGTREGPWRLVLNRGRFVTDVETRARSFDRVLVEVFRRVPDWADDRAYHSLVTVVFRLRAGEAKPAPDLTEDGGLAVVGVCDHLGMVLLDLGATRALLEREGLADTDDFIAVLGSTEIGDELVRDGSLIPLWGMRPWLYRLVVPSDRPTWLPLGSEVTPSQRAPRPPNTRTLTVAPGRALLDVPTFLAQDWPTIRLRDERARSLHVGLWSLLGYEPIAPVMEAVVLPTFLLCESSDPPPSEPSPPFEEIDPFLPLPPTNPWSATKRYPGPVGS